MICNYEFQQFIASVCWEKEGLYVVMRIVIAQRQWFALSEGMTVLVIEWPSWYVHSNIVIGYFGHVIFTR